MPTEYIFDLSGIDLSARAADREAIGRFNLHRGVMAMIDAIVWHDATFDHAVAVRHVRADEFWTEGHIPGFPILPGVLMLESAAQVSSWMYYNRSSLKWFAGFTHIDNVVFRDIVVPGKDLYLAVRCVKYHIKRFITDVQGIVDGRIVFDGQVTGMAFPKLMDQVPATAPAGGPR